MAVARVGASRTKPQLVERLGQAAGELGADQSYFVSFMHERERFDSYRFLLQYSLALHQVQFVT